MRLCIPVENNNGKESRIFGHFGSAPYFALYDTDSEALEILQNDNAHHAHGMCHPLGALTGQKIDAVVCAGMGARALERLAAAGVTAYQAAAGTVDEAIRLFKEGTLPKLSPEGACQGHGCH